MISMNCRLSLTPVRRLGIPWVSPGVNWGTELQPFSGESSERAHRLRGVTQLERARQ